MSGDDSADTVIVVDTGSDSTKFGFAGEDTPRLVVPTTADRQQRRLWQRQRLNTPTATWDDMADFWLNNLHCNDSSAAADSSINNNAMRVEPRGRRLLFTENESAISKSPKALEVVFESLGVGAMQAADQSVLCVYTCGITTGFVVHIGDGGTHFTPVWRGNLIRDAFLKLDLGGADLTNHIMHTLSTHSQAEARHLKESSSALLGGNNSSSLALDFMFHPTGCGGCCGCDVVAAGGVQEGVWNSLMRCDIDIQADLWNNIVLCGGGSLVAGFPERLRDELQNRFGSEKQQQLLNVVALPSQMAISPWLGGSIVGSLSSAEPDFILKAEYDECGAVRLASKQHSSTTSTKRGGMFDLPLPQWCPPARAFEKRIGQPSVVSLMRKKAKQSLLMMLASCLRSDCCCCAVAMIAACDSSLVRFVATLLMEEDAELMLFDDSAVCCEPIHTPQLDSTEVFLATRALFNRDGIEAITPSQLVAAKQSLGF